MTDASLRPARPVVDLDDALARLREGKGRATTARRAILALLFDATGPLTAERVATAAVPPLDLASTYRNLEHLEELGIIRHVHFGHGPAMYELARGGEHEYTFCEACGTTRRFDPGELEAARRAAELATGLRARFTHFPLVGLCPSCRTTSAGGERSEQP